eukprot:m.93234 g.93234  ORF g.93234 m.93234 type:complete len:94 (-) comp13392_c0_seq2:301-582(-)
MAKVSLLQLGKNTLVVILGKIKFSDGSSYEGYFENGMFHGRGMYVWSDGSCYEGDWKANKPLPGGTYKDEFGVVWVRDQSEKNESVLKSVVKS